MSCHGLGGLGSNIIIVLHCIAVGPGLQIGFREFFSAHTGSPTVIADLRVAAAEHVDRYRLLADHAYSGVDEILEFG